MKTCLKSETYPPKLKEVRIYFSQKGVPEAEAKKFIRHLKENITGKRSWKHYAYVWVANIRLSQPWLYDRHTR